MRFVLVNWYFAHEGVLGGCESFHEKLASVLKRVGHVVEFVSYETAAKSLNVKVPYAGLNFPEVEAALLIDKHLSNLYREREDSTMIVRDAGVGGFMRQTLPQICVFGNPYFTLNDKLLSSGLVDILTYNRYHDICTYLEKRTAENSLQNVALSNFMAKVEMQSLGIHCHKVINNAVDTEAFKPRAKNDLRVKYELPADGSVACWVGSSHPIKGIGVISELISRFRDVHWVLVFKDLSGQAIESGSIPAGLAEVAGSYRQKIFSMKRRRIRIFGQLQPQQLSDIYSLSDFAVLPYLCEGNSHVVLEACSCNLPLVTTRTGLFWDFWDDRIGVPIDKPHNVEEYCDAISGLMSGTHAFEPRNVVLERKLDLQSWGDAWAKYLTEDVASTLAT